MADKDFKVEVRLRNILGGVLIGIVAIAYLELMINDWGLFHTPSAVAIGLVTISVAGVHLIK